MTKRCSRHNACRRMSIPECFLLVAQRISKYPLLIEPIIKTTPDNTVEKKLLIQCLSTSREILSHVDGKVDEREKERRLFAIYNKMDARSTASFGGKPFKKSDVLSNSRKLIYEGHLNWICARGKSVEVLAVVLSDVVFFVLETNHKSSFISLDNKSGVVPLSNLLVREKGDTKDSKGLYLIHKNPKEPEMYEFVCKTVDQRKQWIQILKKAIEECPHEGTSGGSPEEGKLQEALEVKLKSLIEGMHNRDEMIQQYMTSKELLCTDLLESICKQDLSTINTCVPRDIEGAAKIFQLISDNVSALLGTLQSGNCQDPTNSMTSQICHQLIELQQNVHQLMMLYARQCTDFYRLLIEPDRQSSFRDVVMETRYGSAGSDEHSDDPYREIEKQISSEEFRCDFIAKSVEEIRKKKQDLNNQLIEVEQMKSDLERERLEFYSMKEKFISSAHSPPSTHPPTSHPPDINPPHYEWTDTITIPNAISRSNADQLSTSASYHSEHKKSPVGSMLRLGSEEDLSRNHHHQDSKIISRAHSRMSQRKCDVLHGSLNDKMLFVQPKIQISDLKKKFFNNVQISPRGRFSSETNETNFIQPAQLWRDTQSCSGSPGTLGGCSPQSTHGLVFMDLNQTEPGNTLDGFLQNENNKLGPSLESNLKEEKCLNFMHEANPTASKNEKNVLGTTIESEAEGQNKTLANIYGDNSHDDGFHDIATHFHDLIRSTECEEEVQKSSEKSFHINPDFHPNVAGSITEKSMNSGGNVYHNSNNNTHPSPRSRNSTSEISSKMSELKMSILSRERKSVLNISLKKSEELPIFRNKKRESNKIQESEKHYHVNKDRSENFSDSETQEKRRLTSNSFCRVLAASIGSLASFYTTFSSSSGNKTSSPKTRKNFKTASVKPPLTTTMSATDVLSSNRRCSSFFVSRTSKDRKGVQHQQQQEQEHQHHQRQQQPQQQRISRHKRGTSNSSNDSISEDPSSLPATTSTNEFNDK